ncbi:hypothetical protein [Adhaeribacter radiodurans]|uniref:Uncharacterized protein n=1 Tax=Adhaeribacter radiodurans TaxID=2745197 RepID=A0A7L7LEX2_9BACT|nr:hypothetical protein [Adhaeribacter radiodurans]QMU31398.1 hypothetical protein HUW48_26705 [Adhaeribacter radiodurans]
MLFTIGENGLSGADVPNFLIGEPFTFNVTPGTSRYLEVNATNLVESATGKQYCFNNFVIIHIQA